MKYEKKVFFWLLIASCKKLIIHLKISNINYLDYQDVHWNSPSETLTTMKKKPLVQAQISKCVSFWVYHCFLIQTNVGDCGVVIRNCWSVGKEEIKYSPGSLINQFSSESGDWPVTMLKTVSFYMCFSCTNPYSISFLIKQTPFYTKN